MASQRSLVRLLVLCLLCGACAAAKRRYHSVSMDQLLRSKAHIDCPPLDKSGTYGQRSNHHAPRPTYQSGQAGNYVVRLFHFEVQLQTAILIRLWSFNGSSGRPSTDFSLIKQKNDRLFILFKTKSTDFALIKLNMISGHALTFLSMSNMVNFG